LVPTPAPRVFLLVLQFLPLPHPPQKPRLPIDAANSGKRGSSYRCATANIYFLFSTL